MLAYVLAHWQAWAIAILAVDAALIPLFPNAGILGKIKSILSGVVPPPAP